MASVDVSPRSSNSGAAQPPFDFDSLFVSHSVQQSVRQRLLAEWTQLVRHEPLCVSVVEVGEDRVVFAVPAYEHCESLTTLTFASRAQNASCPLCFLSIHQMFFKDRTEYISVCSNPGCERGQDAMRFQCEAGLPHRGDSYEEVFDAAKPLCSCAIAALDVFLGEEADQARSELEQLEQVLGSFQDWFQDEAMHRAPPACRSDIMCSPVPMCEQLR
jgi:hypothetical protein